jgi:hypothetical protein
VAKSQVDGFNIAGDVDDATSSEPVLPDTIADELCLVIRKRLADGFPKAAIAAAAELLTVLQITYDT